MADAPPVRPGLFAGLAKILHLHQLPQATSGTKNTSPKGDNTVLFSPARNTPIPSPKITPLPPVSTTSTERAPLFAASTKKTLPSRAPIPSPVAPPANTMNAHAPAPRAPPAAAQPIPRAPAHPPLPSAGLSSMGNTHPKWAVSHELNPPHTHTQQGISKGVIVTDYDRILDLVKARHPIKLDEIARLLSLKEELVAQELQTLEDNGLVEVKYPAFGEPLIYFKTPEA